MNGMNDTEIGELMEKLKKSNKAVIVEGRKDKAALEGFGIRNIIVLNKPLFEVVEDIAAKHKEVVILTDLDREGKLIYGRLSSWLSYRGVRVDNRIREFLFKNTRIRQIEGIKQLLQSR